MKSQNLLSSTEINWLKDPNLLLTNKSETRRRIREKIIKSLNTLDFVLSHSNDLDQEYWDSLFPAYTIIHIISKLTYYDDTRPSSADANKLAISGESIKLGFKHYQSRFKKTKFFYTKIMEINDLLSTINEFVTREGSESTESKLYTMRKKWGGVPPEIMTVGLDSEWRSLCMMCYNWSTGKNKTESIHKIKHHVNCKYNKIMSQRFIHTLPPRNQ